MPNLGCNIKSSNKKGDFARCCKSTKNVDNESDSTVEEDINFIASDSEPELGVLKISETSIQHSNPKTSVREYSPPPLETYHISS